MSNGRNADHVTLPAVCPLFSIAAIFRRRRLPHRPLVSHMFFLTERRRSDCLLFTLLLHNRRSFSDRRTVKWYFGNTLYITQTDYRVIAIYKTAPWFSQLPWTWTQCEVTATERDMSCDRSVSRQSLRVASRADCVLFILRIPLSPTSLLTDVSGSVAMRKSAKHLFFCK